jgi:hypothetical protein
VMAFVLRHPLFLDLSQVPPKGISDVKSIMFLVHVMMCGQSRPIVAFCFQQVADEPVGNTFRRRKSQQVRRAASEA